MNYCMQCMNPHDGAHSCPHCGFDGAIHAEGPALRPGTVLHGRYLLGLPIGRGGFGVTYIGRDTTLDLRVAVKEFFPFGLASRSSSGAVDIIDPSRAGLVRSGLDRFLKEARILARLSGANGVVNVRDFFEENSTAYIVMEYLDGADLRAVLQERLFSPDEIFSKMRPLMDSLEKIHAQGVVHLDISPDNIMLMPDGSLKLMDFGAAIIEADPSGQSRTVMLKRGYAPPEQYTAAGDIGPWTDIYALCATAYRCITGLVPPESPLREKADDIQWPSQMGLPVSRAQENVLKKGMEPSPAHRFRSIAQLKKWLNAPDDGTLTVYIPKTARKDPAPLPPEPVQPEIPRQTGHSDDPAPTTEEQSVRGGKADPPAPLPSDPARRPVPRAVLIAVCSLAAALALVLGALGLSRWARPAAGPAPDTVFFTLTASDMSLSEYSSACEIVQARLNVFAGEDGYTWQEQNGVIRLGLPRSVFGEYDPENVLRAYITRPIDIFLFDLSAGADWDPDRVALTREDLASVVLFPGTPPGAEPDACEQYIALTLTDEAAERLGPSLSVWESIGYGQDVTINSYFYMPCIPAGDGHTFYLVNSDRGDRFHQTLLYDLTHAPSPNAFGVTADLIAIWEDPAAAQTPGQNQVRVDELTGDTVTMFYETYADSVTVGERLDTILAFKSRLDSFSVPYAFGTPDGIENGFAVRIGTQRMGWALMNALGKTDPFSLRSGLHYISAYSASLSPQDGSLLFTPGQYNKDETLSFFEHILSSDDKRLRLCVGGLALMETQLSSLPEDGSVLLNTVSVLGGAPAQEAPFLASVIAAYAQNPLPHSYTLAQHSFSEGASFALNYLEAQQAFTKAVHSVRSGLNVHFSEDCTTAYVHLDLNVDEAMPAEAAALAQQIYSATDFASSDLTELVIYMTDDEDEQTKERARIFFYRLSELFGYSDDSARVCASGIFINGRMERYLSSFRALIESDPFYTSLADPRGSITWTFSS